MNASVHGCEILIHRLLFVLSSHLCLSFLSMQIIESIFHILFSIFITIIIIILRLTRIKIILRISGKSVSSAQ